MTPKEKAKDLVNKIMPLAHDWEAENKVAAVKIALLCVDEIIKATQREYINDNGTGLDIIPVQYWIDVKQELLPGADLKFILWHRETKTEIEMPVLSICEEYSSISFSTKDGDYNDDYKGIGRLPSYTGNDTAEQYDVFVEINGVRHLYDGLFYNSDYTETKRKKKQL